MNLSGIRISAGFYDYNSIENQTVTVGSELPAELPQSVTDQAPSAEGYTAPAAIRKSGPDQGAIDYANSYQPDAVYELKGVDCDIARLDVERAISDMRKDQVLEQYQFFVGTNPDEVQPVRPDENFIL